MAIGVTKTASAIFNLFFNSRINLEYRAAICRQHIGLIIFLINELPGLVLLCLLLCVIPRIFRIENLLEEKFKSAVEFIEGEFS